MPWFKIPPTQSQVNTPNYSSPTTHSIDHNGKEVIAAGTKSRYMSFSVADNASAIYVNYGAAVDVANNGYLYVLPASFQNHKVEIPAQAIHMATAASGETADIIIAVAE